MIYLSFPFKNIYIAHHGLLSRHSMALGFNALGAPNQITEQCRANASKQCTQLNKAAEEPCPYSLKLQLGSVPLMRHQQMGTTSTACLY